MDCTDTRPPPDTEQHALALGRALGVPADAADREARLYARYVSALALLCECAPLVDDESQAQQIDRLLAEAAAHYPLDWRRAGMSVEIAPRGIDAGR
jgi:hypothetical protein